MCVVRTTIQRHFYRTGLIREEIPLRNGRRHGVARTWHKNGVLASEEPYRNGVPHGICRQWDEQGRLLGKYSMVHGTGVQQAWHDNGQLQMEVSTRSGREGQNAAEISWQTGEAVTKGRRDAEAHLPGVRGVAFGKAEAQRSKG